MSDTGKNFASIGCRAGTLLPIAWAVLAMAAIPGCRRKETARGGGDTGNKPVAVATSVPGDIRPVIRQAAQPGLHPFEGLEEPRGAAVDDLRRLWVADFGHSRVMIFDPNGGLLGILGGSRGNGKYQLTEPAAVAVRASDVYVADTWNGRVQHYSTSGEFRETTATQLYGPRGVAVASDGTVWIADTGNNRIAMRRGDDAVRFFGKAGSGPEEIKGPIGVAIGPSGKVYVADTGNQRIQVLRTDLRFDKPIAVPAWSRPMEPFIAVGPKEELYVTVPIAGEVLELDRSGKIVHRWDKDSSGEKLVLPTGLALDRKSDLLYVVNTGSKGISTIRLGTS